ncbi:putative bifunctional diguanylate cyclase/phosphodiesterase [Methyloversatilis thermotolerans]|uniref:putative bifunctional diguanylate cyclase/phosphodiesterase n=1 Tax=Methyloversatilis thermotolerans TaxID=1346290 RepID=UPI00037C235A|nr:EAL domain-containing protein [Methyloversatilis thermotolerans]
MAYSDSPVTESVVDDEYSASIRAQQLRSVVRFAPLSVFSNICNATLILVFFGHSAPVWASALWFALVLLAMRLNVKAWLRNRAKPFERISRRTLRRASMHSTLVGVIWVLPIIALFDRSQADQAMLHIVVTGGMLCSGGFILAGMASAAVPYVFAMWAGMLTAFLLDDPLVNFDLIALFTLYVVLIAAFALASTRSFVARLRAEAEAERQREVVGLLLRDFEAHASDWLWETDARGFLQNPSARMSQHFGRPVDELRSRTLIGLLKDAVDDSEDATRAIATLEALLGTAQPFRDHAVCLRLRGDTVWWSLTAKPLVDPAGAHAGWRGVCTDITESRIAAREMTRLANYDSLTGLANRHHFRARLEAARVPGGQVAGCAMFMFDLDDFKNVNDSLGHDAGDLVLKTMASRMQMRIREGDVLARLGGDEFALLCRGCQSVECASEIAARLLDAFATPVMIDGVSVKVGSSIGIALAPQHGDEPDVLLKNADMALYAAKAAGRNTWRFFESAMDERARHRLSLHSDLLSAVERGEFELHFQPQICMQTGRIAGFEALIRWHHPQRGMVSPAEFISLAEETGLILPIGQWALEQACRVASEWPQGLHVAVNVSAVQFANGAVVGQVGEALKSSGLDAHRLEIEITESLLIHDSASAREALVALRDIGIGVALDDFGTGYSSLAYLRSFPMTKIKIDRSFVNRLTSRGGDEAIVRAIIQLAEALGLETTAEGVEQWSEWEVLAGQACTFAQGFLLSRPLPAEVLPDFIARWPGADALQPSAVIAKPARVRLV